MAYTNEFYNLLRKNRRKFGLEEGLIKAAEEADNMSLPITEKRDYRKKFKTQKTNYDLNIFHIQEVENKNE